MRHFHLSVWPIILAVSGCASYAPESLPHRVTLPHSVSSIVVDPARLPFRNLSTHLFNPADGLDMDEVAMLAVANNPQLRQARDALGIARAQSFAAGLLPDPQFGVTSDHPTNGAAGNSNAFSFTPSFDVSALLLRSARSNSALAQVQRVNLELLWQEWQVVSQARLLFSRLAAQQEKMSRLQGVRTLLADRYQRSRQALSAGNVTLDFASAELAALEGVERRVNDLERSQLHIRASLNDVLGLDVGALLPLVGEPKVMEIDAAAVRAGLEQRLAQRPDLRALQAGYRSQEEKLRGAVLAQFPALNVGLTRARDTSGLYSVGFGLTLTLPVFNRNRGNIAIQDATRKKLHDEYQNRLNAAYSEISIALENLPLLGAQLQRTRQGMAELKIVTQRAEAAFHAGNLAESAYVRLRIALLDKQVEAIDLQESLTEQRIALEILLGPELPEQSKGTP